MAWATSPHRASKGRFQLQAGLMDRLGRPDIGNVLKKPQGPGERLEETYDVGKVLGRGAYGTVREVRHKSSGTMWAVKSIPKAKLMNLSDITDVQREVAIMNHVVGHPNIVSLKDTFEDLSSVHLVMDLCSGGELFDAIVEAGSYSEATAADIFRKMVSMIQHCHDLGVMHRDLKPENFLLTCQDPKLSDLKATDFGLSVFFHPEQRFSELVGSPFYIAPEVLDKNYTYQADYWSLGVILYILLSGLPPFWGDTEEQIFDMVKKGEVNFSYEPWPSISPSAKDLVMQLLNQEPGARPRAQQILEHPWFASRAGAKSEQPIDSVVLARMRRFAAMGKLKKAVLMVVASCLSPEEIQGMQELFQSIDTDGSGFISVAELRDSLLRWDHRISTSEVEAVMKSADVDGDGTINYQEFVAATLSYAKMQKEELVAMAFQKMDLDGSGSITTDELEYVLGQLNIEADVEHLVAAADINGDGQIDYNEFLLLMRSENDDLQRAASIPRSGIGSFNL